MEDKLFTIGYRARFPDILEKYLKPSLDALQGEFDVVCIEEIRASGHNDFNVGVACPAENYNEILFRCNTPYLILLHEDVSFSPDMLERIQDTINEYPEFGAIGLVGCDSSGTNRWSCKEEVYEVDSLDSCLIVVRLDYGLKFDQEIFNGLHLYVEDYCARLKSFGKSIYTIKLGEDSYINHHSSTWHQLGPAWGNYQDYKKIFTSMYPNIKTT